MSPGQISPGSHKLEDYMHVMYMLSQSRSALLNQKHTIYDMTSFTHTVSCSLVMMHTLTP